ncbi:SIR2 family NAD-dependent protein deacylase [Rossellomorea yichunensis]|uniref:SIR2 family NAD-dependent protein deacylase n=1 Tax=Rossellomorea yichunensis TaxID=3077331 RepID=UPI0028DE3685|nr:SIR2 family protein [Rossellomorea sp. YC4-1]MDT9027884.1 SIR2 family protein [Rossellomorea sp. YC4-1]
MSRYLEDLQKDYQEGNLVPFIGAGLSIPFEVPSWGKLIESLTERYAIGDFEWVKKAIETDLNNHDYWGAIDMLKKYLLEEEDIQEKIVELILEKQVDVEDDSEHNYRDLSEMDFNLFLTTNYENILQKYLAFDLQPILLRDINFNTQNLFSQKRVCQLHGTISNSGSIVISKESYEELYNDKKYDDLLKLVTGNKKLIFLGFSFDDQFIRTLIEQHKDSFKGVHYILLDNPDEPTTRELRSKFGLRTIPYNTEGSTHSNEIRKILHHISQPLKKKDKEKLDDNNGSTNTSLVIGAGLKSLKKDLEGNLFYRKLKLENINPSLIRLSSVFYVAADEYIKDMNKLGMPIDVIDLILGQVFIEYMDKYANTFEEHGDSEEFLKVVHKSLEDIDFGRYDEILRKNKSNKSENRGFVHILADNEEDVWWGRERFK